MVECDNPCYHVILRQIIGLKYVLYCYIYTSSWFEWKKTRALQVSG
jgi:hypothetical protein